MPSTASKLGSLVAASACVGTVSAASATERIRVQLSGEVQQWVVASDQNISASSGVDDATNPVDIKSNSDLFFFGEANLDNGLTIGLVVDLEANTNEGGQIGDSYIFAEKERWGLVHVGGTDNVAVITHVGAPDGGISINDGDLIGIEAFVLPEGFEEGNTLVDSTFLQLGDDTSGKISYYLPRINGVQVGISYIPRFEDGGDSNSSIVRINGQGPARDGVALGLNLARDINGASIEAYAGSLYADSAPANGSSNVWGVGGGLVLSMGEFELGGSVASAGGDAPADQSLKGFSFDVGAAYSWEAYRLGITYLRGISRGSRNDSSDQRLDQLILSGSYVIGPGIEVVGGIFYYDADGEKSVAEDEDGISGNHGFGVLSGLKLAF